MEFRAEFGLVVTYNDNWQVTVQLSKTFQRIVTGFCGNFDDFPSNDKRLANGTDASGMSDPGNAVGRSYIVKDDPERGNDT